MTVERIFHDCPECGGIGHFAWYSLGGGPPEQIVCERCQGVGTIDPLDKPDNSEPMGHDT
jgi:hypothetical protein